MPSSAYSTFFCNPSVAEWHRSAADPGISRAYQGRNDHDLYPCGQRHEEPCDQSFGCAWIDGDSDEALGGSIFWCVPDSQPICCNYPRAATCGKGFQTLRRATLRAKYKSHMHDDFAEPLGIFFSSFRLRPEFGVSAASSLIQIPDCIEVTEISPFGRNDKDDQNDKDGCNDRGSLKDMDG